MSVEPCMRNRDRLCPLCPPKAANVHLVLPRHNDILARLYDIRSSKVFLDLRDYLRAIIAQVATAEKDNIGWLGRSLINYSMWLAAMRCAFTSHATKASDILQVFMCEDPSGTLELVKLFDQRTWRREREV